MTASAKGGGNPMVRQGVKGHIPLKSASGLHTHGVIKNAVYTPRGPNPNPPPVLHVLSTLGHFIGAL